MPPFARTARLRYWFDNTMARGTVALIGWLAVLTVLLVVAVVGTIVLGGLAPSHEPGQSVGRLVWDAFMHALSPEPIPSDTGSWPYLVVMFGLMLGGLFIASTLIGVLTSGIEGKLDDLRRGRSVVAEEGHTVVLGWTARTPAVVRELVLAHTGVRRSCVAVLAPLDRTVMEAAIREAVGRSGRMRIVCRTGDPIVPGDLDLVNPHFARSVIVLSPEDDEPDAQVLKMIMALTTRADRAEAFHIVAEMRDPAWRPLLDMVGRAQIEVLAIDDVVGRIIAQAARQTGLSLVVRELLTFEGNEIYVIEADPVAGATYGEALFALRNATPLGVSTAEGVRLNPSPDRVIEPGERLVVLSRDGASIAWRDDEARSAEAHGVRPADLARGVDRAARPEHLLLLGWSPSAPLILHTLDAYFAPGSTIDIVTRNEAVPAFLAAEGPALPRVALAHHHGDGTDRALLDGLDLTRFDHVIVLSDEGTQPQQADTRALVKLLHLRDIAERTGARFNIVSEMNDERNQVLAEVTRADDFVVSDRLISLMVAQIAENRALAAVFHELFSPEGAEFYLRPVADYVATGRPLPFYGVVEAARRRGETAVGYRCSPAADGRAGPHAVVLNPAGTDPVTFRDDDRLIVLATE